MFTIGCVTSFVQRAKTNAFVRSQDVKTSLRDSTSDGDLIESEIVEERNNIIRDINCLNSRRCS